jgi:hypothetical protein
MRLPALCAAAVLAAGLLHGGDARAQKRNGPRDDALNPTPAGDYVILDAIFVGAQASYENRTDLEEGMSKITTRVSGLVASPFMEATLNVDVNVFLWAFGATLGYKQEYGNLQFFDPVTNKPSNELNTLDRRTDREAAEFNDHDLQFGLSKAQTFPYAEGRMQLVVPLAESVHSSSSQAPLFMLNRGFVRWEDRDPATFDSFHVTPHDGGVLYKYEGTLFYRNRDFGAVGPSLRWMNMPRDGHRANEFHYGFTLVTSPQWQKSDILLWNMYFDFANDKFGQQAYQRLISKDVPGFQLLLVYRSILEL